MDGNRPSRGWSKKALRALWLTLILTLLSVSATTLYYKGLSATSPFSNNILVLTLVNLNFILVILLTLLLSRNLIKLFFERRHRRLGTGFRTKLTVAFVSLSLIPSLLLFVVASGLLTAAVENWFGLQVERSLNSALEVAQSVYEEHEAGIVTQGRSIAREILRNEWWRTDAHGDITTFLAAEAASAGRREIWIVPPPDNAGTASVWDERPIRVVSANTRPPFTPPPDEIREAQTERAVVRSTEAGDAVWAAVPIIATDGALLGSVLIESVIPNALVQKLESISSTYEDYNQLKMFKNPIKGGYVLSFLIITLLIIFSATWFGFYVARGVTGPIQKLAEGTQAVAQGNLDFSIDVEASDELRVLVDSFNTMTRDLKASKEAVERSAASLTRSNEELDARRTYMETILETIATGVVSVDRRGVVTIVNPAAERILGITSAAATGRSVREVFGLQGMEEVAVMLSAAPPTEDILEREIQVTVHGRQLALRVVMSRLRRPEHDLGLVMIFDDLSELIKAQKAAAWQEVAQRIAHEIKNPLTPIQLSAQRLRKKAAEHAPDLQAVVDEATTAIINEVTGLKSMVDEFSGFARMPLPRPEPLNIHDVLREVVHLYQSAYRDVVFHIRYEADPATAVVDRDQMKRVFTNLIENAVEAIGKHGEVWVTTSFSRHPARLRVEIADDGPGINPDDLGKLFLPYFSKKKSGTGLGLAIVQRIVTDHNGQIRVAERHPRGTAFVVELPPAPENRPSHVSAVTA